MSGFASLFESKLAELGSSVYSELAYFNYFAVGADSTDQY